MAKHLIVLSAPSGAGKTTVARHLMETFDFLRFSVSATTRPKRPNEVHGKDYFFLSNDEFKQRIQTDDLTEYEEIFGNYYGTLKSVVEQALHRGDFILFDVDVKGALALRNHFPSETLLLFVAPPNMAVLEERLRSRKTETDEQLAMRLSRAEMEMGHKDKFDEVIVNLELDQTLAYAEDLIRVHTLGSPLQSGLFDEE